MQGILLLAHGSRLPSTITTMESITALVQAQFTDTPVQQAYLQFCDITLEIGLAKLLEQGVDDIKVLPYFLFDGVHIKEDIPAELEEFKKDHPHVKITMGKTLGVDKRLAEIAADRIREM